VTDDLVDLARPGELIEVTGVYRNSFDSNLNSQHGFPVFSTVIGKKYIFIYIRNYLKRMKTTNFAIPKLCEFIMCIRLVLLIKLIYELFIHFSKAIRIL